MPFISLRSFILYCIIPVIAASSLARESADYGFSLENILENDKFRQLEELLPTPNVYRTASGAPGSDYWQQRADYVIDVELDDINQRIIGSEKITYSNNSPDPLAYLWVQLDPNLFHPNADNNVTKEAPDLSRITIGELNWLMSRQDFNGGVEITSVRDARGNDLPHTIVKTMMRIDLPRPLKPGQKVTFSIDWNYTINNDRRVGGRTACEFFEEDGNYIYEIAQWFPRMCAYYDVTGWQNKQYIGSGEFTLEFGDYLVRITAPDDHVVASSGVLQNPNDVLTDEQKKRLKEAETAKSPVFIVTPEEAKTNESNKPEGKKTWVYKADNVRDFAFASSRKFIWDAQGHEVGGKSVMAMSYYPNEGEPLWSRYSTHSIIHTLDVFSKFTFDYPYPVAISVNGPVGGMEYPMICFNGPRPEKDGTYTEGTKYGLISVIIHEVGHNYFPMIVNSDERQWTWMDEGLNSFLQYLAEKEWEDDYPSSRGEPQQIVTYMLSPTHDPIMTNSESIIEFRNNAYNKPMTALNVLRETVLGRELFDFAFRQYSQRWMFKRPTPADLFRTMEDASGVDLDWFWRGWFYTTDHVDISIENVRRFYMKTGDPDHDKGWDRAQRDNEPVTLSEMRNEPLPKRVEEYPQLLDFYNEYDELDVTETDREEYQKFLDGLKEYEKALLNNDTFFYRVDFKNIGGLVMPLILQVDYADDTTEEIRIPAEIWRRNAKQVSKLLLVKKEVKQVTLDPHLETADADLDNNFFPRRIGEESFKPRKPGESKNPMQRRNEEIEKAAKKAEEVKNATE